MARWRLTDAQKHLSEVLEKAFSEGPQTISMARGRSVVISPNRGRVSRKRPKLKSLAEVFAKVPLAEILPPRSREPVNTKSIFD
jgi:hypothetical protein